MKIRTDYVTNSSSSSFILARKGELTELHKSAIIKFVEEKMLGRKILTPESTEEEIQKMCDEEYYFSDEAQEEIRSALKDGKDIYMDFVCFDGCGEDLADMYISLWNSLEEIDGESFTTIKGELDY